MVTSFTFGLHDLGPEVAFSATMYPLEDVAEVMRNWRDYADGAPNEVTSVVVTITFPANPEMPDVIHDRPVAIIGGVYAGPVDEGMEATKPLRELGTPLFDMSGPTPFTTVQTGFDPLFPRGQLRGYWKSQYCNELTDDAIDVVAARAQERPAPLTMVNTFLMEGRSATSTRRRPHSQPARLRTCSRSTGSGPRTRPPTRRSSDSCARPSARVSEFGTGDVYLNFSGDAGEDLGADAQSALGRNMSRLEEIKAKYDPDNLFRVNHNISPAGVS